MKSLSNYLLIACVLLGIGLYYSIRSNINTSNDRDRISNNFSQLKKQSDDSIRYYRLKSDEISGLDKKLDSILKLSSIKPKNLNTVTTINNHYKDTTIINVPSKKLNDSTYEFNFEDGCISVGYIVSVTNDSISSYVEGREFNNTIYYMSYKERKKYSFLGLWKWRFLGKKQDVLKFYSDCGGINATKIDVEK